MEDRRFEYGQPHGISKARIAVVGVGGGGGNAVQLMKDRGNIEGVTYITINTDSQVLEDSNADIKIRLADLGAGGEPEVGRILAERMKKEIEREIENFDMIFITAGMGGGTGTGASPIVAQIAKEKEILTVAVVTKPFEFEGDRRKENAEKGIIELKKYVDSLIIIPNERLMETGDDDDDSLFDIFLLSNRVLLESVKGVGEIITKKGLINVDFADVKQILKDSGESVIGLGETQEPEKILDVIRNIVENPLIERGIKGANKMLLNITLNDFKGSKKTFANITKKVKEYANNPKLDIIFGVIIEKTDSPIARVTIVATDFIDSNKEVLSYLEPSISQNDGQNTPSLKLPEFD